MKVLLIHKFHYMKGGTETFHYNLAEALINAGHDVIFFSMSDKRNIPCNEDRYFVSNVDYNNENENILVKIRNGLKLIYSFEAKNKIEELLKKEKPDIAHIGLIHRQISFSVVDVLKKYNIPIVMHLHDLIPICPNYTMLKTTGEICQECVNKSLSSCIKNRCIKGSTIKSILGYIEAKFLRFGNYYNKINLYIAECEFYKDLFEYAKFTQSRIIKMNNFLPVNQEYKAYLNSEDYFLYFGRFSREKGILTILESFAQNQCREKLLIVGSGPERSIIETKIDSLNLVNRVILKEAIYGKEMERIIENSKAVIVPSEWYENGAFVVLQSLAKGKIVIASDIAGLSEIIEDGVTGFLAKPGQPESFSYAIEKVLKLSQEEYEAMSYKIVQYAKKRCDWKIYIGNLLEEYKTLIKASK